MILLQILSALCILGGTVFIVAAAFGVVRFPDFYSRLHAAGTSDTLGQLLVILGLILAAGFSLVSLKLAMIAFFIFILNPTATHALARGAWVCGIRPWRKGDKPFRQREGQMTESDRADVLLQADAEAASDDAPGEGA